MITTKRLSPCYPEITLSDSMIINLVVRLHWSRHSIVNCKKLFERNKTNKISFHKNDNKEVYIVCLEGGDLFDTIPNSRL